MALLDAQTLERLEEIERRIKELEERMAFMEKRLHGYSREKKEPEEE